MAKDWTIKQIDGGTEITPSFVPEPSHTAAKTPQEIIRQAYDVGKQLYKQTNDTHITYVSEAKHVCDMSILTGKPAPNGKAFLQRQCSVCQATTTFDLLPAEEARARYVQYKAMEGDK